MGAAAPVLTEKQDNGATKASRAALINGASKNPQTHVVYVSKENAKRLKTELEKLSLLDKRFRMTPACGKGDDDGLQGNQGHIAVPITDECMALLSSRTDNNESWYSLVEAVGTQQMPLSTSQFASKKKKK